MGTPLLNAEDKVGPIYFAELKIVDASVQICLVKKNIQINIKEQQKDFT